MVNKEKPRNWAVKLLLEESVPFAGGVCQVNFLEGAGKLEESHQCALCFTNTASGGQVIISLGGGSPPQLISLRHGVESSTVVSPVWGPELASDVKGVLELHQDGLLVFGSPTHPNELSFRTALAQDRLPYLHILEDRQCAAKEEVIMNDLVTSPLGMQHGSNRRVTILFQGEGQPKARVSLDTAPIVSRELGSNFLEMFPMEENWKIMPSSSSPGPVTGDVELEMDALLLGVASKGRIIYN
jgi:hypothetical protein